MCSVVSEETAKKVAFIEWVKYSAKVMVAILITLPSTARARLPNRRFKFPMSIKR